jgi:hypothetical protein
MLLLHSKYPYKLTQLKQVNSELKRRSYEFLKVLCI